MWSATRYGIAAIVVMLGFQSRASAEVVGFDSDRWVLANAEIVDHLGRKCLRGVAYLKDVEFENGVIEVDLAVDGRRSYPGIVFRRQSDDNYERFYVRPHRAGLYTDALQYTPVFNRVAGWQLYHGPGFTAGADLPIDQWIHLRMEIQGTQARVYLDDADQPALVIDALKHGVSKGTIGVFGPRDGTACFSNFAYRLDDSLEFEPAPEPPTPAGVLAQWELSGPFAASALDRETYPSVFMTFRTPWQKVTSEPSGLVDVSRYARRTGGGTDCILARTVVRSNARRDVTLSFGYSDELRLFHNGRKVFTGVSGYRSRDPSFLGVVGLFDAVHLTLEKGLNEILLIVSEDFGGWGFMCRADRDLDEPVQQHELLTKVWETPAVFKIPESVLYDPKRDILYVSSFNRLNREGADAGFLSKVSLDGEIVELEWVTGLDGPCGMAISDDRLFVAESVRGNLVEIDLDTGQVRERHPFAGSSFLNDVAADGAGNIYVSNSSRSPKAKDIYKFSDGEPVVWQDGYDLHGANGLFVHGNELLVGNSGDGSLKSVGLDSSVCRTVINLGAGVVDGIRVDRRGNYLVSNWEGKVYFIPPSGEIVEMLDTMADGQNTANFEFVSDRNLLVIPTFMGNRVTAYRLEQ